MKIKCPKCKSLIDSQQINIAKDVAFCEKCSDAFKISQLFDEDSNVNAEYAPNGAWYNTYANSAKIGASTKSPVAILLIPFIAAWSGISMTGIYGTQITSGKFNLMESIFGLPFLIGTIFLVSYALMCIVGKIEIEISDSSSVFVGIGSFGWTRTFDLKDFQSVYEEPTSRNSIPFSNPKLIIIQADKKYRLMPSFKEERHDFVLKALRNEFNKRKSIS